MRLLFSFPNVSCVRSCSVFSGMTTYPSGSGRKKVLEWIQKNGNECRKVRLKRGSKENPKNKSSVSLSSLIVLCPCGKEKKTSGVCVRRDVIQWMSWLSWKRAGGVCTGRGGRIVLRSRTSWGSSGTPGTLEENTNEISEVYYPAACISVLSVKF